MIMILAIYAIAWQQIIKRIPLTTAYANKAVGMIWGMVWGKIIFDEHMTVGKIIGIIMVMMGIICYVMSDEGAAQETNPEQTDPVEGQGRVRK